MKLVNTLFATSVLFASVVSLPFASNIQGEKISVDTAVVQEEEKQEVEFEPVDDMHHFMEYVTKPAYRELKKMLAEEDIRRSTWRKIQQQAMVMAETTILVADRGPDDEEKAADWRQITYETYVAGKALYKASVEKDRDAAVKNWGAMIDACNKCHEKYDENNHEMKK